MINTKTNENEWKMNEKMNLFTRHLNIIHISKNLNISNHSPWTHNHCCYPDPVSISKCSNKIYFQVQKWKIYQSWNFSIMKKMSM